MISYLPTYEVVNILFGVYGRVTIKRNKLKSDSFSTRAFLPYIILLKYSLIYSFRLLTRALHVYIYKNIRHINILYYILLYGCLALQSTIHVHVHILLLYIVNGHWLVRRTRTPRTWRISLFIRYYAHE